VVLMIANHYSASLSKLDMEVVQSIPSGGNWKDVPNTIACKRIEAIRASFARGEGSRSTYYGRLRPDAPSYTINTYFSRPGNGCHIHYAQDRVISQREAARFQSFPDSFEFHGSKAAIAKQIGNSVAPLLAFQVAQSLGEPGVFVDLFAGAGGLTQGFIWAGWTPLVANDIDAASLKTYSANLHDDVVLGDIRDPAIRADLLERARRARRAAPDGQFLVLGGPPCQGFSTAGKKRTMSDERNSLYNDYRSVVDALSPDGFVFENVTGLLNMEKGQVFDAVRSVLGASMSDMRADVLKSEHYGVAQRRWRVFVVARRHGTSPKPPEPLTDFPSAEAARRGFQLTPGARDAIGDLPPVRPGEDASHLPLSDVQSAYQEACRGLTSPSEYIDALRSARANMPGEQMSLAA
jgi:DNA (cytosine-5)-methyltransferase 1